MRDNRNIRLIISLAVLLVAASAVFLFQRDVTNPVADPLLFKIEDPSAINEVKLVSRDKNIDLKYNGSRWMVSNKFEADGQLIKVLMATIAQVVPKRLVSSLQKDSVSARMKRSATRVGFYSENGLVREFEAGGNEAKTEAWFTDLKTGETYVMIIPGYRVYASGIFDLVESEWRDKRIFNFNWRNLRRLQVTWPHEPGADFEFVKQKDFLGIVGLENPDSTRINNFLQDVLTLGADQVVAAGSSRTYDSLLKTPPVFKLEVTDIARQVYSLELFGQPRGEQKIIGKALNGEVVLFDKRKLFSIAKKRAYFKSKPVN